MFYRKKSGSSNSHGGDTKKFKEFRLEKKVFPTLETEKGEENEI